jgi:hypothetical protein
MKLLGIGAKNKKEKEEREMENKKKIQGVNVRGKKVRNHYY